GWVDLPVEAEVALVGVVGEGDLNGVVVGGEASGGEASQWERAGGVGAAGQKLRTELGLELSDDLLRERIELRVWNGGDPSRGIDRVGGSGDGIFDRCDEIAGEFVLRGQREDGEGLEDLTEAFVVEEEEELV